MPIDLEPRDANRSRAFSMPPAASTKQRAATEYSLPDSLATRIDCAPLLWELSRTSSAVACMTKDIFAARASSYRYARPNRVGAIANEAVSNASSGKLSGHAGESSCPSGTRQTSRARW
jgi:hypothetical protein